MPLQDALATFKDAKTPEERRVAFRSVCEWVADEVPARGDTIADAENIDRAARAKIREALGIRTTLRTALDRRSWPLTDDPVMIEARRRWERRR